MLKIIDVYTSLPASVSRTNLRAVSAFLINELFYPVKASYLSLDDGEPAQRVFHGGYNFRFHATRTVSKQPKGIPTYLAGSQVFVFRCCQRDIDAPSRKSPEFGKTRNRRVREDMHCRGEQRVYFPSADYPQLRDRVFIRSYHRWHRDLENRGVPDVCRQWIKENPRPSCIQQREDLMSAIVRGDIPGVDKDLYISPTHIRYWWLKGQRT